MGSQECPHYCASQVNIGVACEWDPTSFPCCHRVIAISVSCISAGAEAVAVLPLNIEASGMFHLPSAQAQLLSTLILLNESKPGFSLSRHSPLHNPALGLRSCSDVIAQAFWPVGILVPCFEIQNLCLNNV